MTATLWHIELSHYNEKVRWALAYKDIEHERRAPMPGTTGPVAMALTRSRHRRLPVLQLDGRTIANSTSPRACGASSGTTRSRTPTRSSTGSSPAGAARCASAS